MLLTDARLKNFAQHLYSERRRKLERYICHSVLIVLLDWQSFCLGLRCRRSREEEVHRRRHRRPRERSSRRRR